ncbi:hypothetical protein MMC27_008373, partial [Xylographa pallens]|nr:hypothetical protein [Xylographa pallens]
MVAVADPPAAPPCARPARFPSSSLNAAVVLPVQSPLQDLIFPEGALSISLYPFAHTAEGKSVIFGPIAEISVSSFEPRASSFELRRWQTSRTLQNTGLVSGLMDEFKASLAVQGPNPRRD